MFHRDHPRTAAGRTRRTVIALAMVGLIGAGCSKAPSSSGSTSTGADTRQQAVKFSECMRAKGVTNFPDPDASGQLTIDAVVNGTGIDANSSGWKAAIGACKDLQPPGFTGYKRTAKQQEGALKFAECIRHNGVSDFPDPTPDSPLIDTNRIPSTERSGGMDSLHTAMQKCRDLSAAAGVTGP